MASRTVERAFPSIFFHSPPAGITGLGVVRPETDVPHGVDSKPIVISRAGYRPADDAMCEVKLGVIPVSLRRLAYDARSRCHSLVWLRRDWT